MHTPEYAITPIGPLDHDLVDAWIDMRHAVQTHDMPGEPLISPVLQRLSLLLRSDVDGTERYVARLAGEVVAAVELSMPLQDNQHLVDLAIEVHPRHRRRGFGSALIAFVERRAAELGRDTIVALTIDSLDDGPKFDDAGRHFAAARGYAVVDQDVHGRNDLALVPDEQLSHLYAKAWEHAGGYELVQCVGPVPDDIVDGIAALCERMYTDRPIGEELDLRPAEWDAARIREFERARAQRAAMQVLTAVRHIESGEVAGYTFVVVNPGDDEHAWQEDTIVLPEHRGKRLGMILKIANQRLLLRYRPMMRYVHTWNGEGNDRMVAINEAIGYRPLYRGLSVQKKLA